MIDTRLIPRADQLAALARMTEDEIAEKFDIGYHTKHVDTIFRRVFGEA